MAIKILLLYEALLWFGWILDFPRPLEVLLFRKNRPSNHTVIQFSSDSTEGETWTDSLIDLKYLNHAKSMLTFSVKIFFCPYDLFQQQIERRRQNEQRNPWEAAFHDYVLAQRRQAPARTAVSYSGNADEAGVHMGNTAFNNLLFYYSFNSFLFGLLGCFVMLVVYFMFCYFFQPPPI